MDQSQFPTVADNDESIHSARDAALRFLAYRSRSEAEVRRRLARRYSPQIVEVVITFLREQNYLDDRAFARQWRADRERHRPRGRILLRQELARLGVATEVIDEVLHGMDEEDNAYRAGQKMARRLWEKKCSPEDFRRLLRAHLERRGFAYSSLGGTVSRLWQELSADPLDSEEDPEADEEEPVYPSEKRPGKSQINGNSQINQQGDHHRGTGDPGQPGASFSTHRPADQLPDSKPQRQSQQSAQHGDPRVKDQGQR